MEPITLREATPDDAEQLADLAHELNVFHDDPTRPSPEALREHFPHYHAVVAQDTRGRLVGYITGYHTFQFHTGTPGFEVQNIAVTQRCRRTGVGRRLMAALILEHYRQGVRKFTLGVEKQNPDALAFYQSLGFAERDFGETWRCYLIGEPLEAFIEKTMLWGAGDDD